MPRTNAAGRRRRVVPAESMQTVSYTFHRSTAEAVRELAQQGLIANASAFVEDAVKARLRELWWERRDAEYARAAADPEFVREMRETEEAFREVDAESLRSLGEA